MTTNDHPSAPDDLRAEVSEQAVEAAWAAEEDIRDLLLDNHFGNEVKAKSQLARALAAALPVLTAGRDGELRQAASDRVDVTMQLGDVIRERDEAREQLAARDQVIERLKTQRAEDERWVQGVLDAVREVANNMHDPLRGLSMSGGEVQDTLQEILDRATLADPGQWEAEVKAAALREARQFFLAIDMPIPADHIDQMLWALKGEAQDHARADRVADGGGE